MEHSLKNEKLDPRRWVEKYGDVFFQYALRRLNDTQAAEDVVQDTFLAAIKSSIHFRGEAQESTWLSSILRRKTVDVIRTREHRRKARMSSVGTDLNDFAADQCQHVVGASFSMAPSQAMSDQEFRDLVQDCLGGLPQNQADVFVMRELEQRKPEEICEILEISRKNLWVRLYRARVALANCISDRLDFSESQRNGHRGAAANQKPSVEATKDPC